MRLSSLSYRRFGNVFTGLRLVGAGSILVKRIGSTVRLVRFDLTDRARLRTAPSPDFTEVGGIMETCGVSEPVYSVEPLHE